MEKIRSNFGRGGLFIVFFVLNLIIVGGFAQTNPRTPVFLKESGIYVGGLSSYSFFCEYLEVKDHHYVSPYHGNITTMVETQEGLFTFHGEAIIKSGLWVYSVYDCYNGKGKTYKTLLSGPLDSCPKAEDLIPPSYTGWDKIGLVGLALVITLVITRFVFWISS